jgi:hypothetical protein
MILDTAKGVRRQWGARAHPLCIPEQEQHKNSTTTAQQQHNNSTTTAQDAAVSW